MAEYQSAMREYREQLAVYPEKVKRLRLLVDPSEAGSVRSSAWAVALRALSDASEVKIQLNLSNRITGDSSALALAMIGPVNRKATITELADLDGLTGTTRVELAWTKNLAKEEGNMIYARATGSRPQFQYRISPGLNAAETRKSVFGGAAGIARKVENKFLLRAGYRYERSYKPQSEQSICTPVDVGVPNALRCVSIIIGEPREARKNLLDAEYRFIFGSYFSASAAVSYDIDNKITGFDLPIWMIPGVHTPGTKPAYGGGLRFGYRSDNRKHPTISVFVGGFKL